MKYWRAEPWGAWRDNLHTAILCREVLRPHLKKGARVKLDDFFYRDPVERASDARGQVIGLLRMIGKKRSAKDPRPKRKRKARARGATANG